MQRSHGERATAVPWLHISGLRGLQNAIGAFLSVIFLTNTLTHDSDAEIPAMGDQCRQQRRVESSYPRHIIAERSQNKSLELAGIVVLGKLGRRGDRSE